MTHLEKTLIYNNIQLYRRKELSSEMLPDLGDTETLKKKNLKAASLKDKSLTD